MVQIVQNMADNPLKSTQDMGRMPSMAIEVGLSSQDVPRDVCRLRLLPLESWCDVMVQCHGA